MAHRTFDQEMIQPLNCSPFVSAVPRELEPGDIPPLGMSASPLLQQRLKRRGATRVRQIKSHVRLAFSGLDRDLAVVQEARAGIPFLLHETMKQIARPDAVAAAIASRLHGKLEH